MDTEDRKTGLDTADGGAETNVIRFPGDWIGPSEELVPIATSVPSADSGPLTPDEDSQPRVTPQSVFEPDAFWSENSNEIHSVLLAAEALAVADEDPAPVSRRRQRLRAPALLRTAPGRSALAIGRSRLAGTAAAVACGLAVLVMVVLGEGTQLRPPSVTAVVSPAAGGLRGDIASLAVLRAPHVQTARRPSRVGSAKPAARKALRRAGGTVHVSSGALANVTPHGSSSTAPVSVSAQPAGSSVESTGASSRPASASGPVGPGAPFGPGSLG